MKKSTEWCKDPWHCLFILMVIVTLGLVTYGLVPRSFFEDSVGAAWVQAIGSVLAIFVGFVQSSRERRFALEDAELKERRRIEGILVQIHTIAKRADWGFREMRHYIGDTAPFDKSEAGHTHIAELREAVATGLDALQRIDVSGLDPKWLQCYISICRELRNALSAVEYAKDEGGHAKRKTQYIQSHRRFWQEGLDPINIWVNERYPPKEQ